MDEKIKFAVFISGGGTNLQSIIDRCADGFIQGEVVLVISNKKKAYGLVRAQTAGIDTIVHKRKKFPNGKEADDYLMSQLNNRNVDIIALSGYLKMLPPVIVEKYCGNIVNIHPGILPDYGGKGMYGLRVHKAVIDAGAKESAVTIHYVDEIYDHGQVIAEKRIQVMPDDTPEELAARVLKVEHQLYPEVLKKLAEQKLKERQK